MTALGIHRRPACSEGSSAVGFETLYRANIDVVASFFARRTNDPQIIADLTSETFVRALASIGTFEARGSIRAWLLAIARAVYAQHCADSAETRQVVDRLSGQVLLEDDELEDLAERIDAQRAAREVMARAAHLSESEQSALELVDLAGMAPREAAKALGISPGTLRVRLFRARARLRKEES